MSIDSFVELISPVTCNISILSFGERIIEISSEVNRNLDLESNTGDKIIVIGSSVYADEVAEKLRYEEIQTTSKVVGKKYQIIRPPNQRV